MTPYSLLYAKQPLLLVALHGACRLSLDLSDCGLTSVPEPLLLQTQLTSLNLGKNNIQVSELRKTRGRICLCTIT